LFLAIFFLLVIAAIWNIESKDLMVFFTSTITVIGIAFFANWSILSNITASLILYFNHPLKIGETLRIYDKEFDIEGELIDLSFFFMYIRSMDGSLITIPTSAVLNKTVIIKR
jgi:small-conductance mechanosensitive channel